MERKHWGRGSESEAVEGWAFFELDLIDHTKGGAPGHTSTRCRLLAGLLAHWDNKSENQRLVCLLKRLRDGGKCSRPWPCCTRRRRVGPRKVDLKEWGESADLGRPRQLHGDHGPRCRTRGRRSGR